LQQNQHIGVKTITHLDPFLSLLLPLVYAIHPFSQDILLNLFREDKELFIHMDVIIHILY
jgi:hypothetical protein